MLPHHVDKRKMNKEGRKKRNGIFFLVYINVVLKSMMPTRPCCMHFPQMYMYELNSTSGLMRIFCTLVNFLLKSLIYWLITLRKYLFFLNPNKQTKHSVVYLVWSFYIQCRPPAFCNTLNLQLFLENRNHIAFVVYEKH